MSHELRMSYEIIKVDPLSADSALFPPELASRILLLFNRTCSKETAEVDTRRVFARLCLSDPTILVLAVTSDSQLIGHGIANLLIDQYNGAREVFVQQCDVDTNSPQGVVADLIEQCEAWGREHKATKLRFNSPLDLHTARAWAKKYGFKLTAYEMERLIEPV